jgi:hypothetical protein
MTISKSLDTRSAQERSKFSYQSWSIFGGHFELAPGLNQSDADVEGHKGKRLVE